MSIVCNSFYEKVFNTNTINSLGPNLKIYNGSGYEACIQYLRKATSLENKDRYFSINQNQKYILKDIFCSENDSQYLCIDDLKTNTFAFLDQMKEYGSNGGYFYHYKSVLDYINKAYISHLNRFQSKDEYKLGIYSESFKKWVFNTYIKRECSLLDLLNYLFILINKNSKDKLYLGLAGSTVFFEVKDNTKKSFTFNHHIHSINNRVIRFRSKEDLKNVELNNLLLTLFAILDSIIARISNLKTLYYFNGRYKSLTIKPEMHFSLEQYLIENGIVYTISANEDKLLYSNSYGLHDSYEISKPKLTINMRNYKNIDLKNSIFNVVRPKLVNSYVTIKKENVFELINQRIKKVRRWTNNGFESYFKKNVFTSFEITKFRINLANHLLKLIEISIPLNEIDIQLIDIKNKIYEKYNATTLRTKKIAIINKHIYRNTFIKYNNNWSEILKKENKRRMNTLKKRMTGKERLRDRYLNSNKSKINKKDMEIMHNNLLKVL